MLGDFYPSNRNKKLACAAAQQQVSFDASPASFYQSIACPPLSLIASNKLDNFASAFNGFSIGCSIFNIKKLSVHLMTSASNAALTIRQFRQCIELFHGRVQHFRHQKIVSAFDNLSIKYSPEIRKPSVHLMTLASDAALTILSKISHQQLNQKSSSYC